MVSNLGIEKNNEVSKLRPPVDLWKWAELYLCTLDVYLGAMESHPGALEAHPGALEADPGSKEAHLGAMEAHPESPWTCGGLP